MNPSRETVTIDSTRVSDALQHRWDGHMADDVGNTYGPEPMAFLAAGPDEIVLSSNRGTYRIPRASVTRIARGKLYPWFFAAVQIRHAVRTCPRELQFKPLGVRSAEVKERLRDLGYPVG